MATRNVEYIISLRDNMSKNLANINKNLLVTGKRMQSIGKSMSLFVTLPIVAAGAAAVKFASDFEETESKFNTVFSNIAAESGKAAMDLRDNFGLSSLASKQLLSDTGDLLTGFGFTQESALDLSVQVNKLAVDLASFTNFSGGAEGASAALTKALLGERESVKSLGISILESDVKAKVLLNTQKGLRFESNRQAKAFATLQIAQEQSKNAIGDFERTSGSFANQLRITKARLSDLAVSMGKILLPAALKLVKIMKGMIERFNALSPAAKKTIIIIAGLVAAIGPLLFIIGKLIIILPTLGAAITFATGPIGLIIVGIAALIALVIVIIKKWDEWGAALSLILGPLGLVISLIQSFRRNWEDIKDTFRDQGIIKGILKIGTVILDAILMPVQQLLELISKIPGIGDLAGDAAKNILSFRKKLGLQTEKIDKESAKKTQKLQKSILEPAKGLRAGIISTPSAPTKITSAAPRTFIINVEKLVETVNNNVTNLKEGMTETKKIITETLLSALNDVQLQTR